MSTRFGAMVRLMATGTLVLALSVGCSKKPDSQAAADPPSGSDDKSVPQATEAAPASKSPEAPAEAKAEEKKDEAKSSERAAAPGTPARGFRAGQAKGTEGEDEDDSIDEGMKASDKIGSAGNAAPSEAGTDDDSSDDEHKTSEGEAGEKKTAGAGEGEDIDWDSDDPVWPVAAPLVASVELPGDEEEETLGFGGKASGGPVDAVSVIWTELSKHEKTYLRNWRGAFGEQPSPTEVADAFNELAFAVTGPKGFWRDTLPNKWLGCGNNGETEPCKKLAAVGTELTQWDTVQKKLGDMSERKAKRFLKRNVKRMVAYFQHYVPAQPSESGMKQTGFYKAHLDGVL